MLVSASSAAIVGALLHVVFWVVTLPFRIFFKVSSALGGLSSGLLLAPVLA